MSALKNYDEAAAWLNVPVSWLKEKVQQDKVPHTRLGHYVRFSQQHLDQIVADGQPRSAPISGDKSLRPISRRRVN